MVRTNQGGSILGFVIIGAVLAILLVGGAYFVRHNLSSVLGQNPVAVDNSGTSDSSENEGRTGVGGEGEDQPDNTETPAQTDTEPDTTTPNEPVADEPSTPAPEQPAETDHTPSHDLPQTGPGEAILAGLLLSSIVGVAMAYIRSRV